MAIDENTVREIVRKELESLLISSLTSAVRELQLLIGDVKERQKAYEQWVEEQKREISELREVTAKLVEGFASLSSVTTENTNAITELRKVMEVLVKQTEENTKAITELRKQTEENTKAITELRKQTEENTKAITELRKQTEENTKAITELRKQTEENTKAITELRKQTEENTKAITELRKQTEENTKAITELRKMVEALAKQTEENTKAIAELRRIVAKLVKAVEGLNRRVGGLENTFGLIVEDYIRKDLILWFQSKGTEVKDVRPKTVKVGSEVMEFDAYIEVGNMVYVGEIKATLRKRDMFKLKTKVDILRNYLKDKEVVPFIVYRLKRGKPEELGKMLNITVVKYMKGGYFEER
ncbi:hypothetical protein GWK48_10105 [Metallosphaera tengchongensis]|uniref:Uncharacterized protein n=1 Tax=Metallosphaera tengchongensis TaxID=1532350 RepID=A0A6N0NXU3_9CREN|nr:hypothetical protein [Metallosphaera tengchongensis]QKR00693.1 hypothetical protein GWK48_10105 [Metallosphaera tengchongensis]